MANQEERIFKKTYTDFDKRLDQELEEEKIERRRQLMLQAPDFKLLNQMVENEDYSQELAVKLKDGGLYYLRSGEEDTAEKFMGIFRRTLQSHPSVREDLFKQAGFLGCMAFKKDMPRLGRFCGEAILSGLRLLAPEEMEISEQGYLQFKNVTDTAAHTRNELDFREIVNALHHYWEANRIMATPGLLAVLSDILFVAADRRQINALTTACSLSRSVLCHKSANPVMRQRFVMEWSGTSAQIAQRGWDEECEVLLKYLCPCLGSLRDTGLIKKVMADVSVHMQMQSKWDDFETAFRLYYPCQLFALVMLRWGMRRYRRAIQAEKVLETEEATLESGILDQVERKMELLDEKAKALDLIRFVLRNVRDTAAACARLLMKDEWELYTAWQREWLSAAEGKQKRQKQIRFFMQMAAEYWHSTQPSRSKKQWEFMAEVISPSQLSDGQMELIQLIS
ncbi:MAG: hypothetical protein IJR22_08100 [Acidaminococcaceae bacterium]|nr:hypothetical protein [Acidaminococcaceae bacterium]